MDEEEEVYNEALRRARAEDLSDVRGLDVVRVWDGRDTDGLRVIVVTPQHLGSCDRERAFRFFLSECDAVTSAPYRVVLVHSGRALGAGLGVWAARRVRATLPAARRKNLAAVSVVHPDVLLRVAAHLARPLMGAGLWDKLQLADRIEELELDGAFAGRDLRTLLPPLARRYEEFLEGEAGADRERARLEGMTLGGGDGAAHGGGDDAAPGGVA